MKNDVIITPEEYERCKSLLNSMREVHDRHRDYIYVLQLREIIEQYELAQQTKETNK